MSSQNYSLKTVKKIREFFWPVLEPEEPEVETPNEFEIHLQPENLKQAFDLQSKIYESEEDRRKGIESKASLFLSTISITASLVVASNALITGNNDNNFAIKISVFVSFLLCIYTIRTVWFSVKVLQRGTYHVMGIDDINVEGKNEDYLRHLIVCLSKKTRANQSTINSKVDNLTMAQEYYKRAMLILCLYAFLILIYCFFIKQNSKPEQFQPRYICLNICKE